MSIRGPSRRDQVLKAGIMSAAARHTERRPGLGEPAVERVHRRAVFGGDGKMQSAAAHLLGGICPVRSLIALAEDSSVTVQSLIRSSDGLQILVSREAFTGTTRNCAGCISRNDYRSAGVPPFSGTRVTA